MKRALLSVSDRTGLVQFARALQELGYEIIATGSTKDYLESEGLVHLRSIEEITGFPEMLDGRVKTLHPAVHGGILARRGDPGHQQALLEQHIDFIDLVCVNLYPFKKTLKTEGVSFETILENIDIGGPAMLRSAAKNYQDVLPIIDPQDYSAVLGILSQHTDTPEVRLGYAAKVFAHTAAYDALIAKTLMERTDQKIIDPLTLTYDLKQTLRYGENPFQEAYFYASATAHAYSMSSAEQFHGKELSYNNIQDGDAALGLLAEFQGSIACVALKHTNPCGVALASSASAAFQKVYAADPVSIFGGVVAFNVPVDHETADQLSHLFLEIVLAPSFEKEAKEILMKKKNIRLLTFTQSGLREEFCVRSVNGGLLKQSADLRCAGPDHWEQVSASSIQPEWNEDLWFAEKIVKHVKSNAIVLVKNGVTLGIGCGQSNRIGALKLALEQAQEQSAGSFLASDAFFPMADCVELAAEHGIAAIIQPGGSIKDQLSIDACDQAGIAMVFTHERHFKH